MSTTIIEVVNLGLRAAGIRFRINDIYEGSAPARVALDVYGQTRDELLMGADWSFAQGQLAGTSAYTAPVVPPSPWLGGYVYPVDCLRVRYMRPGPAAGGARNFDPQPVLFEDYNDLYLQARTILCDVPGAIVVYVRRVTNPAQWAPNFERVFVARLAEIFSFALTQDGQLQRTRATIAGTEEETQPDVTDVSAPSIRTHGMGAQPAQQGQ